MWFKSTFSLAGMFARDEDHLPAEVELKPGVLVRLWVREVPHDGRAIKELCCDAIVERQPKPRNVEVLDGLRNRRLVLDDPPQLDLPYTSLSDTTIVDTDGRIAPKWIIPAEIMPREFRTFQRVLARDLHTVARDFITTLRWAQGASGDHAPLRSLGSQWSEDGKTWHRLPPSSSFSSKRVKGVDALSASLSMVADLLSESVEPFAHELIREASDLVRTAPRSALLIAVSALETGLKHYITHLVPNAEPLLDKMPSPSVLALLQEVIPEIHRKNSIKSTHFPMSEDPREYLKKWISQRNLVAHGNKDSVNSDDVQEFVDFATDILYVLDFHRGHDWALSRLTSRRFQVDQEP